jgi:hypothetical protein
LSERLTVESIRRALIVEPIEPARKLLFVVPPVLVDLAREHFGSAADVIEQARIPSDYDDHLLRRKKPQPNPKPR